MRGWGGDLGGAWGKGYLETRVLMEGCIRGRERCLEGMGKEVPLKGRIGVQGSL